MSLPSLLLSFYSWRDVRGSEEGEGGEVITEGVKIVVIDPSSISSIFVELSSFLFFL